MLAYVNYIHFLQQNKITFDQIDFYHDFTVLLSFIERAEIFLNRRRKTTTIIYGRAVTWRNNHSSLFLNVHWVFSYQQIKILYVKNV